MGWLNSKIWSSKLVGPLKPIGTLIEKVSSWNPAREAAGKLIQYIDLSSIDVNEKLVGASALIRAEDAPSRARQVVRKGDVLVSTVRPNLNGVARVSSELDGATGSTGFSVLRADPDKLDSAYLFHWVKAPQFITYLTRRATGASYPAVNDRIIFESAIPLPPLDEQRRLAAILDHADDLRCKRRLALEKLNALPQAVFQEMFGDPIANPKRWPEKPLSRLATFENGDRSSNYPSGEDLKDFGVLFLSTRNIVVDELRLDECRFITQDKFNSLSQGKTQIGDLIITLRGTLGSCCVVDERAADSFINAQMMIIRPGAEIERHFLHSLLTKASMKRHLNRLGTGVAVSQLTARQFADVSIIQPPLELQRSYVDRIVQVEQVKAAFRSSLRNTQYLFASLQHRAFSGQLLPSHPDTALEK